MIFFPYKADVLLPRMPYLTIFISILCLLIYWQQEKSEAEYYAYISDYCQQKTSRVDNLVMKKLAELEDFPRDNVCAYVYLKINIAENPQKKIADITDSTSKFFSSSAQSTHKYINDYLNEEYDEFKINQPQNLTHNLWYQPESYNVFKMITASVAHGNWSHVFGNLFFFFAFSATLEAILGFVFYSLVMFALALGTNIVYSLAILASPEALPTLGLSGVVMGAMGLFTYFLPKANIKCFFWFVIFFRRFMLPAWLLALWYFGLDVYAFSIEGMASGTNLVAHISGFVIGFMVGMTFFKQRRQNLHIAMTQNGSHSQGVLT